MLTTANKARANQIKTLALHSLRVDVWGHFSDAGCKQYEVEEPGFKYNMMDLHAARGISQPGRVAAHRCTAARFGHAMFRHLSCTPMADNINLDKVTASILRIPRSRPAQGRS